MRKRVLFLVVAGLVLFVLLASGYVLEDRKGYPSLVVTGRVTSFTADELRVQSFAAAPAVITQNYTFKLTADTRFTGTIENGAMVKVTFIRERLNKHAFRLLALAVEVTAAGR